METKEMNIYQKLINVQAKTVVKKTRINEQNKSKHRNAEDGLQALKPQLVIYNLALMLSDEIIALGDVEYINNAGNIEKGNRFYIKATATLINVDNPKEIITQSAFSNEALQKKGVQPEMLTGMASTYARKRVLAGLFLFAENDAIDPDDLLYEDEQNREAKEVQQELYASIANQIENATGLNEDFTNIRKRYKNSSLPKQDIEILENKFMLKGQELKQKVQDI